MFAKSLLVAASVAVLGVVAAPNPQITTTIIITTTTPPVTTVPTATTIPTTIPITIPPITSTVTATTVTTTPPAPTCARHYSVEIGDTCNAISAAQSVSTFQLAFVNPIINDQCTNLVPNQDLCLGIAGQDCTTVHTVADGDFCFQIAQNAGIPLSTLLTNNPNLNSDCTNLRIGDVLCTSATIFTYTAHV